MRGLTTRARQDDRGGGVVQLPLMATVFILFASLMIFVGRVNSGAAVAEAGASYAARTISLARDPRAAAGQAQADAETTVSVGSPGCRTMDFAYTLEADQVTVDVTCTVELVGLGVPATWQVTGHAEEPIDRWREAADP